MVSRTPVVQDVFTTREIARAAGVSLADADALLASGLVSAVDGGLTATDEAVRAVLLLRGLRRGRARSISFSVRCASRTGAAACR